MGTCKVVGNISYYGWWGDDSVINAEFQNFPVVTDLFFGVLILLIAILLQSTLSYPTPLGSGDPCVCFLHAFGEDFNSGLLYNTRYPMKEIFCASSTRYTMPQQFVIKCRLGYFRVSSSSNGNLKHVWASDTPIIQYCGSGFRKSFWQHILTFSSNKPHTQYPSCFNIKLSSAF